MNDKIQEHIQKMDANTQRLLSPFMSVPSADEWIRDVILSYFQYFSSLQDEDQEAEQAARDALLSSLKLLVPQDAGNNLEDVEVFLYEEFKRKGYYFLGGKTGPHYGPYIWKTIKERPFDVEITDRKISVNVFFMQDFLVRSWMHFQTFGRYGTGGWVKSNDHPWQDGIYSVVDGHGQENPEGNEVFRVALLKHEGQHIADKTDYPELDEADLEYRAKLTELIYFSDMKFRLVHILREASAESSDPHRYAAYWIVKGLSEKILNNSYVNDHDEWQAVPYEQIQREAHQLLRDHTEQLQASMQNRNGVLRGWK